MSTYLRWSKAACFVMLTLTATSVIGRSSIASAPPNSAPISVTGVLPSLKTFFGSHKGRYIAVGGSLFEQFVEVYRGPSDPNITLENGDIFTSATRPGEGSSKAAVIFDPFGNVVAAALISHHCSFAHLKLNVDERFYSKKSDTVVEGSSSQSKCDSSPVPTMTIFIASEPIQPFVRKAFRAWAGRVLNDMSQSSLLPVNSKILVERRVLKK
jgi:hypothetical protein